MSRLRFTRQFWHCPEGINGPSGENRAKRECRSICQRREGAENTEAEPTPPGARLIFELQSAKEENRDEKATKASVPNEPSRDVDEVGKERPNPTGGDGHAAAKTALCGVEQRETNQRREQGVQTEHDKGGGLAVNAEKFEDGGDEAGVDRSQPSGGTGWDRKRIAIAVSFGNGARDSAGFETEVQVIFIFVPGTVVIKTHGDEAQREGDQEDRQR